MPYSICHLVKDLSWGEKEVFLKVNRRKFKCIHCQSGRTKIFDSLLGFVEQSDIDTNIPEGIRYSQYIHLETGCSIIVHQFHSSTSLIPLYTH